MSGDFHAVKSSHISDLQTSRPSLHLLCPAKSKLSRSELDDLGKKQLGQMKFAYMHVLESKMRGMDEQSSLFLARFWPSLQQSSMEICFPPVDKKTAQSESLQNIRHEGWTPFKSMQVFLTQNQNSDGWVVFCRISNSISKQTKMGYFHYRLTLVSIAYEKKE